MAYTRKFNYVMGMMTLAPGFKGAFMDKYLLDIETVPQCDGDKVMTALSDLAKIYGPDFVYEIDGGKAVVKHDGKTAECAVSGGMVDAVDLLGTQLGKPVIKTAELVSFCEEPIVGGFMRYDNFDPYAGTEPSYPRGAVDHCLNVIRGKNVGDTYRMYWNEALSRAIPYRVFIPYAFDPAKQWKLIVVFHGGGATPANPFVSSQGMLQFNADKYGYLIVSIDAGISGSSYGATETVAGMRFLKLDPTNPKNPGGCSEEELLDKKLCEENAEQIIELVCEQFNIDKQYVYLMGNSMGGEGTLHFASTHPQLFRAISPAGAMLNTDYFDDAPLGDMPILLVGGLEDFHGFDHIENGGKVLQQRGRNLTLRAVAGGEHGTAWVMVLDEIFDFFNNN